MAENDRPRAVLILDLGAEGGVTTCGRGRAEHLWRLPGSSLWVAQGGSEASVLVSQRRM